MAKQIYFLNIYLVTTMAHGTAVAFRTQGRRREVLKKGPQSGFRLESLVASGRFDQRPGWASLGPIGNTCDNWGAACDSCIIYFKYLPGGCQAAPEWLWQFFIQKRVHTCVTIRSRRISGPKVVSGTKSSLSATSTPRYPLLRFLTKASIPCGACCGSSFAMCALLRTNLGFPTPCVPET